MATKQTLSERADALEEQQMKALGDKIVGKSLLYYLSDGEQSLGDTDMVATDRAADICPVGCVYDVVRKVFR